MHCRVAQARAAQDTLVEQQKAKIEQQKAKIKDLLTPKVRVRVLPPCSFAEQVARHLSTLRPPMPAPLCLPPTTPQCTSLCSASASSQALTAHPQTALAHPGPAPAAPATPAAPCHFCTRTPPPAVPPGGADSRRPHGVLRQA